MKNVIGDVLQERERENSTKSEDGKKKIMEGERERIATNFETQKV